jgi:hypothetical protein
MLYTVDQCIGPVTKTNARAQSGCELFQGLFVHAQNLNAAL